MLLKQCNFQNFNHFIPTIPTYYNHTMYGTIALKNVIKVRVCMTTAVNRREIGMV